ncbi:hypothetical protein [Streptacidiphilus neutrinimicus]|uniref:hypothetical protein n=1 Tax=Streptacidiphilus neutrinimicus TaxID=105420 RepID=UPI0005AAC1EC|nr:hypothetical protein [Streptacidiphilus neutrinimicus]
MHDRPATSAAARLAGDCASALLAREARPQPPTADQIRDHLDETVRVSRVLAESLEQVGTRQSADRPHPALRDALTTALGHTQTAAGYLEIALNAAGREPDAGPIRSATDAVYFARTSMELAHQGLRGWLLRTGVAERRAEAARSARRLRTEQSRQLRSTLTSQPSHSRRNRT